MSHLCSKADRHKREQIDSQHLLAIFIGRLFLRSNLIIQAPGFIGRFVQTMFYGGTIFDAHSLGSIFKLITPVFAANKTMTRVTVHAQILDFRLIT